MDEAYRPVPRDQREEAIEQALWKARKRLPRKVAPGHFNPYRAAAGAVVGHFERCGITCWRKPLPLLPSSSCGSVDETGNEKRSSRQNATSPAR